MDEFNAREGLDKNYEKNDWSFNPQDKYYFKYPCYDREEQKEMISYESLGKCIPEFISENYGYIAYYIDENNDDLGNETIKEILTNKDITEQNKLVKEARKQIHEYLNSMPDDKLVEFCMQLSFYKAEIYPMEKAEPILKDYNENISKYNLETNEKRGYFKKTDKYLVIDDNLPYSFSKVDDQTCPIKRNWLDKSVLYYNYTTELITENIFKQNKSYEDKTIRKILNNYYNKDEQSTKEKVKTADLSNEL